MTHGSVDDASIRCTAQASVKGWHSFCLRDGIPHGKITPELQRTYQIASPKRHTCMNSWCSSSQDGVHQIVQRDKASMLLRTIVGADGARAIAPAVIILADGRGHRRQAVWATPCTGRHTRVLLSCGTPMSQRPDDPSNRGKGKGI